ncbi:hypothetical protein MVEN_01585400 [Mycena venus]|uniref:Uncharacterized protein n=1 Tax=Mycena venus TaxID=2733690 RepID=A0A8H7CSB3_9AGAR|nr:hypothetical protein MVEN_01585400 [Mycena venus]
MPKGLVSSPAALICFAFPPISNVLFRMDGKDNYSTPRSSSSVRTAVISGPPQFSAFQNSVPFPTHSQIIDTSEPHHQSTAWNDTLFLWGLTGWKLGNTRLNFTSTSTLHCLALSRNCGLV